MQKNNKTTRSTLTLRRETLAQINGGGGIIVPFPQGPDNTQYCNATRQYCGRW